MDKRDFLKIGAALALVTIARPALAFRAGRLAIVQRSLPGALAFAAHQRSLGARLVEPSGDPLRWYGDALRPALAGCSGIVAFTDAVYGPAIEACLRADGHGRVGPRVSHGRAALWAVALDRSGSGR